MLSLTFWNFTTSSSTGWKYAIYLTVVLPIPLSGSAIKEISRSWFNRNKQTIYPHPPWTEYKIEEMIYNFLKIYSKIKTIYTECARKTSHVYLPEIPHTYICQKAQAHIVARKTSRVYLPEILSTCICQKDLTLKFARKTPDVYLPEITHAYIYRKYLTHIFARNTSHIYMPEIPLICTCQKYHTDIYARKTLHINLPEILHTYICQKYLTHHGKIFWQWCLASS